MAQRTTPSLASSEYVSPDRDSSVQVWLARKQLIKATKRVFPAFLKELLADVYPLYSQRVEEARRAQRLDDFRKALSTKLPFDAMGDDGRLELAIRQWAARFHAEVDWVISGALQTLRGWEVAPEWRNSLAWAPCHSRKSTYAMGATFEFSFPGWEPQFLAWGAYSASARQRFEERLSEYEKQTRELAESKGLVRSRKKYSPDNLEWFALYQFAGWTSHKIVQRYVGEGKALEESAVLKGVKAAAELIGWSELRQPRHTRNRKIR